MWEAFEHAGHERLDNLIAIVDVNRLGQRGPTMHEWDTSSLAAARRAPAAGTCRRSTATTSRRSTPPTPRRRSGRPAGGDLRPHEEGRPASQPSRTRRAGTASRSRTPRPRSRSSAASARCGSASSHRRPRPPFEVAREQVERPTYEVGEKVATRGAYGDALAWIGSVDERVVALDGEVGNSTYAERFAPKHPDRFFEMYIAEQQMVAAAVGLADARLEAVRLLLRRLPEPRLRLRPHGRDLRRRPEALRLPRRRLDRPRRAVADGARRHRRLSGRPRQRRPLPLRSQPDGAPRSTRCGSTTASATAHDPRSDPGALRAGRGLRDRRQPRRFAPATRTPSP